eukprot:scaffold59232_cov83-Cyclotella_meneghiniana.AAC.1
MASPTMVNEIGHICPTTGSFTYPLQPQLRQDSTPPSVTLQFLVYCQVRAHHLTRARHQVKFVFTKGKKLKLKQPPIMPF